MQTKQAVRQKQPRITLFMEIGASVWILLKAIHDAQVRPLLNDEARIWGNVFKHGWNFYDFTLPEWHALSADLSLLMMKLFGPGKLAAGLAALILTVLLLWCVHALCESINSLIVTTLLYAHICCNGLMGLFFHSIKGYVLTIIHSVILLKCLYEIENENISQKGIFLFYFTLFSGAFINLFSSLFSICALCALGLRFLLTFSGMDTTCRTRHKKLLLMGIASVIPGTLLSFSQIWFIKDDNFGHAGAAFHISRLTQLTQPFSIVTYGWCLLLLLLFTFVFLRQSLNLSKTKGRREPSIFLFALVIPVAAIFFVYVCFHVNFLSPRFLLFLVPVTIVWAGTQIEDLNGKTRDFVFSGLFLSLTLGCVFSDPSHIIGVCPVEREIFLSKIKNTVPAPLLSCVGSTPDSSPVVRLFLGPPRPIGECNEYSWIVRLSNDSEEDWKERTQNDRVSELYSDGQGNTLYKISR